MKFQTSAALALLATTAQACMQFGVRITGDGQLVGAIVDNGQRTCEFNVNLNAPDAEGHYWGVCGIGFASWISQDLGTLAYANGNNHHRFEIHRNGDYLSSSAYC